jgi:hypothetical protein
MSGQWQLIHKTSLSSQLVGVSCAFDVPPKLSPQYGTAQRFAKTTNLPDTSDETQSSAT